MSGPEGISEAPKLFSIGHADYEGLVDGGKVQVHCDHIPRALEKGQQAYARNKETGGRLPVRVLEVRRQADNPSIGTIRVELSPLEPRES